MHVVACIPVLHVRFLFFPLGLFSFIPQLFQPLSDGKTLLVVYYRENGIPLLVLLTRPLEAFRARKIK